MKPARLWQPRNPAFWLMVATNLLSVVLAWIVRSYPLGLPAAAVIVAFAIGNVVIGLRMIWLLVRDDPGGGKATPGK